MTRPTGGTAPSAEVFRLLAPATAGMPADGPSVQVDGVRWVATPYTRLPEPESALPFTCISYSWGVDTVHHPFENGRTISTRTVPVLEATIRTLKPSAVWLDAFCLPPHDPERSACLRSLGAIYARAAQSVAVLSPPCGPVLAHMHESACIEEKMLQTLELDAWVTRAWTYQEIANCRTFQLIAEGNSGVAIAGDQFLNALGYVLQQLKKDGAGGAFRSRSLRNVESLEEVLADWMFTGLGSRFAYQSMVAMSGRHAARTADYFNAVIGTLTSEPPSEPAGAARDVAELFMEICEARQDYSFIYCRGRRRTEPARRWRPLPGPMQVPLSWHTFGEGQGGRMESGLLHLEGMCALSRGSLAETSRQHIDDWLNSEGGERLAPSAPAARLRLGGLSECGPAIELAEGYFFPLSDADVSAPEVFATTGVRWVHGAPGLLARRAPGTQDAYEFCGAGVFVGKLPELVGPLRLV